MDDGRVQRREGCKDKDGTGTSDEQTEKAGGGKRKPCEAGPDRRHKLTAILWKEWRSKGQGEATYRNDKVKEDCGNVSQSSAVHCVGVTNDEGPTSTIGHPTGLVRYRKMSKRGGQNNVTSSGAFDGRALVSIQKGSISDVKPIKGD